MEESFETCLVAKNAIKQQLEKAIKVISVLEDKVQTLESEKSNITQKLSEAEMGRIQMQTIMTQNITDSNIKFQILIEEKQELISRLNS